MSNKKFSNKIVKNIKLPTNEQERIEAYKNICGLGDKHRGDISSVITKSGRKGMAILPKDVNRSKDKNYHRGKKFVSNTEINKELKK